MRWIAGLFIFFFLFSIAYADVAAYPLTKTANQSWNAGSSGNTVDIIWNWTAADNASVSGGTGTVSLTLVGTTNCTANQSFWNLTNSGLAATNHTATLTCSVAYHLDNYNISVRVNASSDGGGNATNASWDDVAHINVSVGVPVFTTGTRSVDTQKADESFVSPLSVTVASVNSQSLQFACKMNDYQDTGAKCHVRDYSPVTCLTWLSNYDSGFTCFNLGNVATGTVYIPIELSSITRGDANLDWMVGDGDEDRNVSNSQNITFEGTGRATKTVQTQPEIARSLKIPVAGGDEGTVLGQHWLTWLGAIVVLIGTALAGLWVMGGRR